MAKNITVVVRSVGERSEKKCIEYLKNIFGEENVFSVKNVTPFSKAVKETFKIGIKRKKKWTLAIDADVFLFKNEIFKFIEAADIFLKKNPKSYCFEGKLFDKYSQIYREVGCHLYNTKMLKKAVKYADGGYLDNRPETYIKQKMTDKGYGFYVCQYNIGIHDFFQFPHSIVKKAILHCKKHADINDWIQKWKELAERDTDFSYALKGYEIYNSLNDKTIIVDVNFMNNLTQNFNLEQFNQTKELTNEEIDETLKLYNKNENKEIEFILCFPITRTLSLGEKIFSLRNVYKNNKKHKVITVLGLQLKIRKKTKLEKLLARKYDPNLSLEDKKYIIEHQFERAVGYKPNIDNPRSFNEKLQWLKLYNEDPLLTKCADKYLVRDYVKEKIGEEYLIPLLGVWDSPDDIDFDKLPNQFVLKVNWGWGQNIIVKDKSKLNIEEAKDKLKEWLRPESNHYYANFEWCYKNIQPKIIAEQFIQQLNNDLYDYKFFCFNGKFEVLEIISSRFTKQANNFFDKNLKRLDVYYGGKGHSEIDIKRDNVTKMQILAEKLALPFYFARIDFYNIDDKIYLGEITFYSSSGMGKFEPVEYDYKLGEMLTLPTSQSKGGGLSSATDSVQAEQTLITKI